MKRRDGDYWWAALRGRSRRYHAVRFDQAWDELKALCALEPELFWYLRTRTDSARMPTGAVKCPTCRKMMLEDEEN